MDYSFITHVVKLADSVLPLGRALSIVVDEDYTVHCTTPLGCMSFSIAKTASNDEFRHAVVAVNMANSYDLNKTWHYIARRFYPVSILRSTDYAVTIGMVRQYEIVWR